MNKNADLKKRFKEDNTAFNLVKKTVKIIVFIIFSSSIAVTQININGFCGFQKYNTNPHYTKIFFLDYNLDSHEDILLHGIEAKRVTLHKGLKDSTFSPPIDKFFYYPITDINFFIEKKESGKLYLFISRSKRLAGLISFSKFGTLRLMNQYDFNSYPQNISIADIDKDGRSEALISGENFEGLSILREDKFRLSEEKIFRNRIFSEAKFIDLDYDTYPDIAAIDLFSNAFVFFYNNHSGQFRESRRINLDSKIKNLSVADLNLDSYNDLVFTKDNSIQILYGDSVSSFNENKVLSQSDNPSIYELADYNNDKLPDLAFIDEGNKELSIIFSDENDYYSEPVTYKVKSGISGLKNSKHKIQNRLMCINSSGELYFFSKVKSYSESFTISIGGVQESIAGFKYRRRGMNLAFVDSYDQSLKILLSESYQPFANYYIVNLSDTHSNIVINSENRNQFFFYCYTPGKRLVEIIKTDFRKNEILKENIYYSSPIIDLQSGENDIETFYVLGKNNVGLNFSEYKFIEDKYFISVYDSLVNNAADACIALNDTMSVFYWQTTLDTLSLNNLLLERDTVIHRELIKITKSSDDNYDLKIQCNKYLNQDVSTPWSFIYSESLSEIFAIDKGVKQNLILGKDYESWYDPNKQIFQFFYNAQLKKKYLLLYNSKSQTLYNIYATDKSKVHNLSKYIESIDINSYFIANFNLNNTFLVFTANNEHSINITTLE